MVVFYKILADGINNHPLGMGWLANPGTYFPQHPVTQRDELRFCTRLNPQVYVHLLSCLGSCYFPQRPKSACQFLEEMERIT